jgi:hypothetical protein
MALLLLASCGSPTVIPLRPEAPPDVVPIDAPESSQADWTVDCNGGADFETISDAIDAASDGEWIEVAPCTYREVVDFSGKSLWISSSDGPETTIIDARGDYGVIAQRGEGDGSALVGFTIDGAGGTYGAVYAYLAALRLEDVTISSARGGYFVIYAASADMELQDVDIVDSTASYYTIDMSRGAFTADGLSVSCSGNSYALVAGHGSFFLDHSTLSCGSGYAIYNENSTGRVQRSSLRGALYAATDEDHYTDTNLFENTVIRGSISQTYGTLVLRNSILDGGTITGTDLYELRLQANVFQSARCAFGNTWSGEDTAVDPTSTVEYNDFWDMTAEGCDGTVYVGTDGNIAEDPSFTDEASGDYSVPASSPLVDAGLEDDIYDDPDGSRNDIGVYGGPHSVGGGW